MKIAIAVLVAVAGLIPSTGFCQAKRINTLKEVEAVATLESLMWSLGTHDGPQIAMLPAFRGIDLDAVPASYVEPAASLLEETMHDGLTWIPRPGIPVLHLITIDGKKAIILSGFASRDVYNTVRLITGKQRAADVFSRRVLPFVKSSAEHLKQQTAVEFYGIAIAFASGSALADYGDKKGESVVVVTPREWAKRFADGQATDVEVADHSLIFLQDRDAKEHSRVQLALP